MARRMPLTGLGPTAAAHCLSEWKMLVQMRAACRYEVMDGVPVRGESVPIRLFLAPYPLTPSYGNVNNKFSVKYFLNLVGPTTHHALLDLVHAHAQAARASLVPGALCCPSRWHHTLPAAHRAFLRPSVPQSEGPNSSAPHMCGAHLCA